MAKTKKTISPVKIQESDLLFSEIKSHIEQARKQVAAQVNQSLTLLYWQIGDIIYRYILDSSRAEYGKEIVATVSRQLTTEYGNGYSVSALWRMLQFRQ